MKTKKHITLVIMICAWVTTFGKMQSVPKEYEGKQAAEKVPGAEFYKEGLNSAYPSFVRFNETKAIPFSDFFSWAKKNFGNTSMEFRLLKQESDEIGYVHYRYEQVFQGVPVANSIYNLHVKNGLVISFNGDLFDITAGLSPVPTLDKSGALESAKSHVRAEKYMWEDPYWENNIKERKKDPNATYFPVIELCWFPLQSKTDKTISYNLAYRMDINSANPNSAIRIFVDAKTGATLKTYPMESNCTPANVNTAFNGIRTIFTEKYTMTDFRLRDDCQAATIRIRDWNSTTNVAAPLEIENTTNTWTTQDERFGGSVLWQTRQSYLYWLLARGRASYDNANGDVDGYINAIFSCTPPPNPCYSPNNASMSFSGGTMKVGLGSGGTLANCYATLDIIGHEYAHAVTGSSAMLVYQDEPGALNESFSDIFGEMVEYYTLGTNDWLLGEERSSGAIRSMINPPAEGQPDTYQGTNWYTGLDDNGGVHTNSGVQNLWFYLLSQGGSGTNDNNNAYNVSGIGRGSASAIAARMLLFYLGPNSNYFGARTAAISSATDLFGACSNEVRQVMNAWYAVGVGAQFLYATATATSNFNGFNVSCATSCNGTASAAAFNGNGGYQYLWSTGSTLANIMSRCPGTYTVTVTDNNGTGCTASASVTLTGPTPVTAVATALSNFNGYNISCNGGNNGLALVTPGGGAPGYGYLWSNAQTLPIATGLQAGLYSVTVTDANGCTKTASVSITEPPPLAIDAGPNKIVFLGYPDSACTVLTSTVASGGVGGYVYIWSTGGPSLSISVCPVATTRYTITAEDANNCKVKDTTKVCVIDVRCGGNLEKVMICKLKGNGNTESKCVKIKDAKEEFEKHPGGQLGACGISKVCTPTTLRLAYLGGDEESPDVGDLLVAYPNPFSGLTTIRFVPSESDRISLEVFDISGKRMNNIFEGTVEAETFYEMEFDANNLADGIYFLSMRSENGKNKVVKLILAR